MWLVWTARAWLVFGNAAALSFDIGVAALHHLFRTNVPIQIGLSQLGAHTQDFVLPVMVAATVHSIAHVLVIAYSFSSTGRLIDSAIALIWRPSKVRVHPTVNLIVPSFLDSASQRVISSTIVATSAWSRYSAEVTRLFKLWEVSLQTFQAYKISYLVASVSINRLVAVVIVTNCWFSPILRHITGDRPIAHIELGRLMLDSSLDLVYNILIPLWIFYPYYRDFNSSVSLYPVVFYYDDTWHVNAVSELRQIFVSSWPDLISKGSGCVFLVYRLWDVKMAIDNVCRDTKTAAASISSQAKLKHGARVPKPRHSRVSRVLDLALVICGATVFSLHLTTSITSLAYHDPDCLLEIRPWGSLAYSCASFEISCSKRHTTGDRATLEAILTTVDPLSLQNLIFSNCPLLHVPAAIHKLEYLSMVKVYNSTIVSWDSQAALRQVYHPQLQAIYLARVNVSGFPEGLLAQDFPSSVWDIELCITNITTLPPAITTAWTNVGIVGHEGNHELTEYPEVLTTLPRLFALSLGMNNIRSVNDGVFWTQKLLTLGMNGNPVERLPDILGPIDQLHLLNFVETNIAEIPAAWLDIAAPVSSSSPSTVMFAAGSPLCDANNLQTVVKPTWLGINCERPSGNLYKYPIHEEDLWRRVNQ